MLFTGYQIAVALMLAVVLVRCRDALRDPRNLRLRAIAFAHGLTALGFAAAIPANYVAIGTLFGLPNLATLIVYAAIALCLAAMQTATVAAHGTASSRSRLGLWGTLTAVGVMAVVFLLAHDVGDQPHPLDFDAHYALNPTISLYQWVWWSTYTVGVARMGLACHRAARSRLPWLRAGMRVSVVGCVVVWGYVPNKMLSWAASWSGGNWAVLSTTVAPAFALFGAVLIAIGYTLPAVPRWARTRDLRPLWRSLRRLDTVAPPLRTHGVPSEHRMMIRIMDRMLALREHLSPEVARRVGELADQLGLHHGEQRHAAIEAARLAVGLRHQQQGRTYTHPVPIRVRPAATTTEPSDVTTDSGVTLHTVDEPADVVGTDLDGLCRIGRAFRVPHPLVAAVLADPQSDLAAEAGTPSA